MELKEDIDIEAQPISSVARQNVPKKYENGDKHESSPAGDIQAITGCGESCLPKSKATDSPLMYAGVAEANGVICTGGREVKFVYYPEDRSLSVIDQNAKYVARLLGCHL